MNYSTIFHKKEHPKSAESLDSTGVWAIVDSVENFHKKVHIMYLPHTKKPDSVAIIYIQKETYVNKKYPQLSKREMFRKTVDNVDKLSAEQVFTDFYDISRAHSYQQVVGDTIF